MQWWKILCCPWTQLICPPNCLAVGADTLQSQGLQNLWFWCNVLNNYITERFSINCCKTKFETYSVQSQQLQITQQANPNSKQIQVTVTKRGKTCASKLRLFLALPVIGWESGTSFANQSQCLVKQNQSKREITFNTRLKTTLMFSVSLQLLTFQLNTAEILEKSR